MDVPEQGRSRLHDGVALQSARRFPASSRASTWMADNLLRALVQTKAFRRLRDISFLGAIDYLSPPEAKKPDRPSRSSRYEHSVGVAELAWEYARLSGLDETRRRLICSAALLHDIGHPPLSHSLEPLFVERFGLDHHELGRRIILGDSPFGREIADLLRAFDVAGQDVVDLLDGNDAAFHRFFSGPINLDTIDAVTRLHATAGSLSQAANRAKSVVTATFRRAGKGDRDTVDEFWKTKGQAYRQFIYSSLGWAADSHARALLREMWKSWGADVLWMNESALQKCLGIDLGEVLRSGAAKESAGERRFRDFYIENDVDFGDRGLDHLRYRYRWHKA